MIQNTKAKDFILFTDIDTAQSVHEFTDFTL